MNNAMLLWDALGDIPDAFLQEAEAVLQKKRRHPIQRLAAACLAILLIALPVGAEMKNGYVSNLLAPLYGGAQTKIVDSIGVPLDASVTVGDYTLKADAVIGDRYNLTIVYSLTHVEEKTLSEWTRFDGWESHGVRRNSGYLSHTLSEDGKTLYLMEQLTGNQRLFLLKRDFQVDFRDLIIWDPENAVSQPLQEGHWQLRFTIRYEDTTETVWRGQKAVTDPNGGMFTIRKIELSPVGMHMDFDYPACYFDDLNEGHEALQVQLLLKDGTMIDIEDFGMGGGGKSNGETWDFNCRTMFDTPIPMENIRCVVICGMEFPVHE